MPYSSCRAIISDTKSYVNDGSMASKSSVLNITSQLVSAIACSSVRSVQIRSIVKLTHYQSVAINSANIHALYISLDDQEKLTGRLNRVS